MIKIQTTTGKEMCFYDPMEIEFTDDVVSVYFKNGSTHIPRIDVKTITEVVVSKTIVTYYTIYSGVEVITPWSDLVKNGRKLNQAGNKVTG